MKTCGELYQEAIKATEGLHYNLLSLGFLIGQAEKVYIGACRGCMTKDVSLKAAAARVAGVYGLTLADLHPETENVNSGELWIFRGVRLPFLGHAVDSPEWNLQRAAICGVPASEINLHYHDHTRGIR
jgi:hypothetical protein